MAKWYVVWIGRKPGIYSSWSDCSEQVYGFKGARYKSFTNFTDAQIAYNLGYHRKPKSKKKRGKRKRKKSIKLDKNIKPIDDSICVDGAWNWSTGVVEWRGVEHKSGRLLFSYGPYERGTINMAEFLAIVHALMYCKDRGLVCPVYSDSLIAIGWVRKKINNSELYVNSTAGGELMRLTDRALMWLQSNDYVNDVLKWHTRVWGEIPADFGRKG